jgi:hypothetical protein
LKLSHVQAYLVAAAVLHNIAVRNNLPHFEDLEDDFPDEQPPTTNEETAGGGSGNFATRTLLTETFFNREGREQ